MDWLRQRGLVVAAFVYADIGRNNFVQEKGRLTVQADLNNVRPEQQREGPVDNYS